ncbi:MAG: zinc-ribbon domain-containing protein [Oscillospiraceae bacterium]|jgi:DNA-directed RNA polymerase subunit RPC12/RpoP|nr:zinc-ribbon domain-containing protein [Oscillospiraceae bacterium]
MIICNRCNQQNEDDALFCSYCGENISAQPRPTTLNGVPLEQQAAPVTPQPPSPPVNQSPGQPYNGQYPQYPQQPQQPYNGQYPQYQYPQYPQQPYNGQYPQYPNYANNGDGAATGSLVCGIIGLFVAGLIMGIIAIVQGNKAKKLGYTGGKATAGIVLGIIDIACMVLFMIINFGGFLYF